MTEIHVTPSAVASATASIPKDTPILMLNLLRFRSTATYSGSGSGSNKNNNNTTVSDLPTQSGKEVYLQRYVPAFREIAASVDEGIQTFWIGAPVAHLVVAGGGGGRGPRDKNANGGGEEEEEEKEEEKEEKWDLAALVRYPSFQAFRSVTESERYEKEAKPHRLTALEDWRLIATVDLTPA